MPLEEGAGSGIFNPTISSLMASISLTAALTAMNTGHHNAEQTSQAHINKDATSIGVATGRYDPELASLFADQGW